MKNSISVQNTLAAHKLQWLHKACVKFLFLSTILLTTTNCNKNEQPTSPKVDLSVATLVVFAHTPEQKSCIALIELATRIVGNEKQAEIQGRLLRFTNNSTSEITQISKATYYDVVSKNESIFKFKSMADVLENRFKELSSFSKTSVLNQEQILNMLKGESINVTSVNQLPKKRNIEDILISFFIPSAYAQTTPGGDINKIIPELVDSVYDLISDCATPSYVDIGLAKNIVARANENFLRSNYSCLSAIIDLAKKTKNLWDYVAYNVVQALQPNNTYTATSLTNDLKNGNTNLPSTNTQTTTFSPSGGSFGDPHLTTMDGLYYDFQGYGEFIAVKSLTDAFEIQVRQEEIAPYRNGKVTLNTGVAINTGSDIICVFPSELYINKQRFSFSLSGQQEFSLSKGSATLSNNLFTVQTPNNDIIRLSIQNIGQGFLDYRVSLNENRKGKVKGLLGNFDGNRANDVQTQDGKVVNPFVFSETYPNYSDSWRAKDKSYFEYPVGKSTTDYTKTDYPKLTSTIDATLRTWAEGICRSNGITDEPYFSSCVMDVALANSDRYAISAVGAEENKLLSTNFDINQFTSFDDLNLTPHGNPKIENGLLYLTKPSGTAAVYQKYKVDITNGFEVNIDFSFTEAGGLKDAKGELGADGFAFIIQDYGSKLMPLSSGQGLGYDGLPRSLAIEFDTFTNSGQDSPDADIWLNTQGIKPNSVADSKTLIKPQTRPIANLVDGKTHKAIIRYTKNTSVNYKIEVFVDGDANPYLTADNINIQNTIGAYTSGVYFGLTAATAAGYQNHIIHRWAYKTL